jgi:hypothetical protein
MTTFGYSQLPVAAPSSGAKWEQTYLFDAYNQFRVEYYPANTEQARIREYKTYFQTTGTNFYVKLINDKKGNLVEALFDNSNQTVIQVLANIDNIPPLYNVGNYYLPVDSAIHQLDLTQTTESKTILDYKCKKYNYTYKKVVGEVWITDSLKMSNNLGVLRASRMMALHNKLSVDGFVMEMKFQDSNGGKTILKTVSINNQDPYIVDFKDVNMVQAPSKINYYVF